MFQCMGKLRGKYSPRLITDLQTPSNTFQLNHDSLTIANTLAKQFPSVSSDDNFNPEFITHKLASEATPLNFDQNTGADYKKAFSYKESIKSLLTCVSKASGSDSISYIFFKSLPQLALENLHFFYNLVWSKGSYPKCWIESLIIPLA